MDKTTEVRERFQFDVKKLEAYMSRSVDGFQGPLEVRQFKVGQSNPTFFLRTKKQDYVLRRKPPGKWAATAHAVDREFRILKVLHGTAVPVPRVYTLCQDLQVIGGEFYIMEYLEGRLFSNATLKDLVPAERRKCYDSIIQTLAALHNIDWRKIGLEDFGKAGNFYARNIKNLTKLSKDQEAISDQVPVVPNLKESSEKLLQFLPDDRISIVHGDYKIDNFLFHPTESRIIGVLDWEMSTIGHPMSDVAYFCSPYYLPENDSMPLGGLQGIVFEKHGIPDLQEVLRTYAQLTNSMYPDPYWDFYMAFCYFKGAIIAQGIMARVAKGAASSDFASMFGLVVPMYGESVLESLSSLHQTLLKEQALPPKIPIYGNILHEDEYAHTPNPETSNFNESVYFNFFDPNLRMGGFCRIGNRVNEGYAEVTVALYLKDGSALFYYDKPAIKTNNGWDAGGLSVHVVRPAFKVKISFSGNCLHLIDPMKLKDPKSVYLAAKSGAKNSMDIKFKGVNIQLTFEACGPLYGVSADNMKKDKQLPEKSLENFARNHYEQHCGVNGTIEVDLQENFIFNGAGLRDHSWGPRSWQAVKPYRFITGNVGREEGFSITLIGESGIKGVYQKGNKLFPIQKGTLITHYNGDETKKGYTGIDSPEDPDPNNIKAHQSFTIKFTLDNSEMEIQGKVIGYLPLRNQRQGVMTRIGEGLTEYRINQNKIAFGMSEYLNQSNNKSLL